MKRKKLNVLIRTVGGKVRNKELGFGHIYRSINLAYHLKPHKIFFLVEDYGGAKKIIKEKKFEVLSLKAGINSQTDISKTISIIKDKSIDVLIIDKFKVSHNYVSTIRKHIKTVVISDLRKINYNADLVVNGYIGFKNKIITNQYCSRCLVGPAYQILNEKFSKRLKSKNKKYELLVVLGGFDEFNISLIILKALSKYIEKLKTRMILGPATTKSITIKRYEKKYGKKINVINKTDNMQKEIANAKFGICLGGITTYEFANMNLPFAIICKVKHQQTTAREWERKRAALNLGLVTKKTDKKLEKLFKNLSKIIKYSRIKTLHMVDGKGSRRVASEISKMVT